MTEILDLWLEKRFPDEFGPEAKARGIKAMEKHIEALGLPPLSDVDAWQQKESEGMAFWSAHVEAEYSPEVLRFLHDMDLDLKGFFKLKRDAGHQARAGSNRTEITQRYMTDAVDAFLEAESKNLNFAETLEYAVSKMVSRPHETTIRNWLKEIAGKPWSTIPDPPGRGRPKRATSN